jgi:periplasmic divalent cation tolerance protein
MTDYIVILVTAGSEAEAETIAHALVEERFAACVNIISPMRSIYRWQEKIVDDREWLLVVKTQAERFSVVEARVKALHSYQVPEVVALPILAGAKDYLGWLLSETTKK